MAWETIEDIIRALQEHPEWREPLLRALLPERYQQLPERADRLEGVLARLAEEDEAIRQFLRRFAEETETRFRQMEENQRAFDAQLQQLTERLEQIAQRHEELARRHEQLAMRHEELVIKHEQLTARVDELTRRVDELTRRVDELTRRVDELTRRVDELAARVDELTRRVDELAARVDDLTARLEQLAARVDQLAAQMAALVERVGRIEQDLGDLKGLSLEQYYRHNATAILGLFFQKLRVVDKGRLIDSLYDQRALTRQEWEQISKIDLLVKGLHRTTGAEHLLVWEISWTVDEEDVSRALERARLLRQRGLNTLPVVAGKGITGNARTLALSQGVLVLLDTVPLDGSGLA
jgi:chromosome segregation ATPase